MALELWSIWTDTSTDTSREIRVAVRYARDSAHAVSLFQERFGDVPNVQSAPGLVVESIMRLMAPSHVREAMLQAPPREGLVAEAHLRTLIPKRGLYDPRPQWPGPSSGA